jgi:salicylate hydroxylase
MDRYWLIHRADYQRILYDAAIEAGVEVRLGCPISSVDTHVPFVL